MATVPRSPQRLTTTLSVALAALLATTARVHAETERASNALTWGVVSAEATVAGEFTLAFSTKLGTGSAGATLMALAPMVIAPGVAYLSYRAELDGTGPLIVHGAAWMGADLFVLGALIDGRHDRHRLRVGPAALTLGALGVLGGGVTSALTSRTQDTEKLWLAAPVGGALAGGIALGGLLVFIGGLDGDKAISQLATGLVVGLTLGLGASVYYGATHLHEPALPGARGATVPQPTMFSFGGRF
jgi:hypothetical protein